MVGEIVKKWSVGRFYLSCSCSCTLDFRVNLYYKFLLDFYSYQKLHSSACLNLNYDTDKHVEYEY